MVHPAEPGGRGAELTFARSSGPRRGPLDALTDLRFAAGILFAGAAAVAVVDLGSTPVVSVASGGAASGTRGATETESAASTAPAGPPAGAAMGPAAAVHVVGMHGVQDWPASVRPVASRSWNFSSLVDPHAPAFPGRGSGPSVHAGSLHTGATAGTAVTSTTDGAAIPNRPTDLPTTHGQSNPGQSNQGQSNQGQHSGGPATTPSASSSSTAGTGPASASSASASSGSGPSGTTGTHQAPSPSKQPPPPKPKPTPPPPKPAPSSGGQPSPPPPPTPKPGK